MTSFKFELSLLIASFGVICQNFPQLRSLTANISPSLFLLRQNFDRKKAFTFTSKFKEDDGKEERGLQQDISEQEKQH